MRELSSTRRAFKRLLLPAFVLGPDRERPDGEEISLTILGWIIVGLIAGALAKMVVPGEGPGGIIGDIIVGIVGAFIGGWVFNFFGHTGFTGFNIGSIIVAFIGAVILLFILRALTPRRSVI
jgi:uncharacterized membrane protein YeaQ/YmgE (transglycosylase-associated protein family)